MRIRPIALGSAVLAVLCLGSQVYALPASAASPRGAVVFFVGTVKVDGEVAKIGKPLGARTTVETGPGASCEIVFDRKNAVRIGQNAKAVLDFSGIVKEVALERGSVTSVLRKLGKLAGKDTFKVSTGTAVAGVRGTSFCVWAAEEETYICACNGEVRTMDAKGADERDLKSAHHSGRYYSTKGGKTASVPAGLEHHTDADLESLAALIGEKMDWSKEE